MAEESGAKKVHDFLRTKPIGYEFTTKTLMEEIPPELGVTRNVLSGWLWLAHKQELVEIVGQVPSQKGAKALYLYRLLDHEGVSHKAKSNGSKKGRQNRAKKVEKQPEYPVVDTKPGLLDVKPELGPVKIDATGKPVLLSDRLFDLAVEVAALEGRTVENVATDALVEELAKRFKKE